MKGGGRFDQDVESSILGGIEVMRGVDTETIAHHLIDPIVLFVLGVTSKRCMTVSEIAPAVNLPMASCYKIVYQMEGLGLMAKCGTSRTSGRGKAAAYTSILKSISLEMKNSTVHLIITWKNGETDEYHRELSPNGSVPVMQKTRVEGRKSGTSNAASMVDADQAGASN